MEYSCRFHHLVQKDYDEAYEWYESREKGLGDRFAAEVKNTVDKITLQPEIFGRKANSKFREAKLNFFPYLVVYQFNKKFKIISVVSIHHRSKSPRKKYRL